MPDSPPSDHLFLHVAIPSPLRRGFDYLPPTDGPHEGLPGGLPIGARVVVPFGRGQVIGVILEQRDQTEVPAARLKRIRHLLDDTAMLPDELLALLRWASTYYHHPIGEVVHNALPALLRQGRPAQSVGRRHWCLVPDAAKGGATRAPRQAQLLALLHAHPDGLDGEALNTLTVNWRDAMGRLVDKGRVRIETRSCLGALPAEAGRAPAPCLNPEQLAAVNSISARLEQFVPCLLDGVTGSGKTEVYFQAIEQVIALGRQALVLVPEIGLTPQLLARFRGRFAVPIAVLHSGLNDAQRLCAWLAARDGRATIVIGTRSAVFIPLARPGIIVVDEEHDLSYKQQDGFRYSARDVALVRAQRLGVPIVLGSATPSLESLHNAQQGRYQRLHLPHRAGTARPPTLQVLDLRQQPLQDYLSPPLLACVRRHLDADGQVLLFLNRRGYAPTLLCHACGWVAHCQRCDAHMTVHQRDRRLRCHHCGAERPLVAHCPACGSVDLRDLGVGTERIAEALVAHFPEQRIVRIDRDSTRRKGALDDLLDAVHSGEGRVMIGTQMLAKGHHFPNVTLVGIIDTDQGLYSADFRGPERMAQLITQVSGRAGRAQRPGEVIIQTHHPDHPLLTTLLRDGYAGFAREALDERRAACLPPFTHLALLRAEAVDAEAPQAFLDEAAERARALLPAHSDAIQLLGPVASPMERRAGRYRAQLLIQAEHRAALHRLLTPWALQVESLKRARRVRWSLDVDPQEMY